MLAKQLEFELIPHKIGTVDIPQRAKDGYVNATLMCKAPQKQWGHYWESIATKQFVAALSSDIGIPISELIQSVRGGNPDFQGTWVHPQVAERLEQSSAN